MREALMPTNSPPDIEFDHGSGSYLYKVDGRSYLDFSSGVGVNSFGHPYLLRALRTHESKLWHTSNMFRIAGAERLAARLVDQ